MKNKYNVIFANKELHDCQQSIIVSNNLTDELANHYLKNGNAVIDIAFTESFPRLIPKTGLIEGYVITNQNDLDSYLEDINNYHAWMKVLVIDESAENIDLSSLKDSASIEWVLLKTKNEELGDYISQAWKYGFKLWAEKYPLSQQEIPEKVLIYLNSR